MWNDTPVDLIAVGLHVDRNGSRQDLHEATILAVPLNSRDPEAAIANPELRVEVRHRRGHAGPLFPIDLGMELPSEPPGEFGGIEREFQHDIRPHIPMNDLHTALGETITVGCDVGHIPVVDIRNRGEILSTGQQSDRCDHTLDVREVADAEDVL